MGEVTPCHSQVLNYSSFHDAHAIYCFECYRAVLAAGGARETCKWVHQGQGILPNLSLAMASRNRYHYSGRGECDHNISLRSTILLGVALCYFIVSFVALAFFLFPCASLELSSLSLGCVHCLCAGRVAI